MSVSATSGVPVALLAQFEANGTAANPELPIVLTIAPVSDAGTPIVTLEGPESPAVGIFTYAWTPPVVSTATDFLVVWNPAGDDLSAIETVTVYPAASSAWATPEQVANQTGVTVSAATVLLASSIIDTFTGADPDMPYDAITAVDRRHLRKATAWQAAWISGKPGLITERESASSITSDTQNIQRESREDALLAPLARREIASLSWIGTRTAFVRPRSDELARRNFLNESSDPEWFGGASS